MLLTRPARAAHPRSAAIHLLILSSLVLGAGAAAPALGQTSPRTGQNASEAADLPDAHAFNARFDGRWTGSGTVWRHSDTAPRRVDCEFVGDGGPHGIGLSGQCTAAVVFSRRISADLAYDPRTGRYSGVYHGSRTGPARLSGQRRGENMTLNVDFGAPVGDDDKARMLIRADGADRFRIVVRDEVGGAERETTNLEFVRR